MAKPKPIRVPSDDCTVTLGEVAYTPHEGEWVELFPHRTIGELQALENYMRMSVELDAVKGNEDENLKTAEILNVRSADVVRFLADRITDWNWTNLRGQALPKPDGTPGPLSRLSMSELTWLLSAGQGETPSAAKNA